PDAKEERPRLLYHRHFMLAEKLAMLFGPVMPPSRPRDIDRQQSGLTDEEWRQEKEIYDQQITDLRKWRERYYEVARDYAKHLQAVTGAKTVRVELVEHKLPSHEAVKKGRRLDERSSYVTVPGSAVEVPGAEEVEPVRVMGD